MYQDENKFRWEAPNTTL